MNELERLIAEQEADDTYFQRPEAQTVSLETMGEDSVGRNDTYFSGTEDEHHSFGDEPNGVYSFLQNEKGTVLVEGASWHGSQYGYTRKGCRCDNCKDAQKKAMQVYRQRARANKPA